MGLEVEKRIDSVIKYPHCLEYEKTFWPFILFTKKRYVGNKYEFDHNKYKQTSMGIVLKRRDNASIVKLVFGGIIDIIMDTGNIEASVKFLKESLQKLIAGQYPMDLLVITKSLKPTYCYKDPTRIAHWVLAKEWVIEIQVINHNQTVEYHMLILLKNKEEVKKNITR